MPFTVCAVTLPMPLIETLVVAGSTCHESVTGSAVSRAAQTIGRAAFLFPVGRMLPESVRPPSTMNWAEEDSHSMVQSSNGSDRNESEEDNWTCSTETNSVDKRNYSHCWTRALRPDVRSNSMPTTEIERCHSDG